MSLGPIPVIIDTDPGVDDVLAILLALASPELEIKAITISFGNTDAEHSYVNVLKIWRILHKHFEKHPQDRDRFPIFAPGYQGDVPFLARGSSGPLLGVEMNAKYFHGRDGLGDISTRHPEFTIPDDWQTSSLRLTDQPAVELSLDIIQAHPPRSITYIALGPLTNLSLMLQKSEACVRERLGRVVAMGGTLEAPGNTTAVAEFNFYADPFAVREVLHPGGSSCGFPLDRLILLPLDLTTRYKLPFPEYKRLIDPEFSNTTSPSVPGGKSPLTHFTSSFLERTVEVLQNFGMDALELHDPMAVWCAICNPPLLDEAPNGPYVRDDWAVQKRIFQIETAGELTRGMLVVDRRSETTNFRLGDNRSEVYALRSQLQPVPVQSKGQPLLEAKLSNTEGVGVSVVVESPENSELLRLMFERIWGVEVM